MELKIKKLKIDSSLTTNLPLWYNFILYNEMHTEKKQLLDAKENAELGGYHLYTKFNKPISKLIDYSNIDFRQDEE